MSANANRLLQKIQSLPPERVSEIEDFVDFLHMCEKERALSKTAATANERVFAIAWDNPEDDVYDTV